MMCELEINHVKSDQEGLAVRELLASNIIDPATEGHCAFISSFKMTAGQHRHDFHEFFLVTAGEADHLVNGAVQKLRAGSLVYIRPSDLHCYRGREERPFCFINLAFSETTAQRCVEYLARLHGRRQFTA